MSICGQLWTHSRGASVTRFHCPIWQAVVFAIKSRHRRFYCSMSSIFRPGFSCLSRRVLPIRATRHFHPLAGQWTGESPSSNLVPIVIEQTVRRGECTGLLACLSWKGREEVNARTISFRACYGRGSSCFMVRCVEPRRCLQPTH